MRLLIIFICCTLYLPTPAVAGVSKIKQMNRNSDGSFDVKCLNGSSETVKSEAILDNSVCNNETDQSSSAHKSVVCIGSQSFAHVTRISDGKQLGNPSSLKDCQESTRASNKSVVCIGSQSFAHVTRISDGKELGNALSLKDCQESTRASKFLNIGNWDRE